MTTVGRARERVRALAPTDWPRESGRHRLDADKLDELDELDEVDEVDEVEAWIAAPQPRSQPHSWPHSQRRIRPYWYDLSLNQPGDELIGSQLAKLTDNDPSWRALHVIPFGAEKPMDHLVIGPGGVFTVIAKRLRDADVWVKGDTFLLDGVRKRYLREARAQATHVTDVLTSATGEPVRVEALVVPLLVKLPVTIRRQPGNGVHVVVRRRLEPWLQEQTPVLHPEQRAAIFDVARRSTTWV
jgi:hypothetical protein